METIDRKDRHFLLWLAGTAGWVDSAGFVLVGSFTSQITSQVGQVADEAVRQQPDLAADGAGAIVAFFVGAFICTLVVEGRVLGTMRRAFAALLIIEAILVALVVLCDDRISGARLAMVLCLAMGIHNTLATLLTKGLARATHVTELITTLGAEAGRWLAHGNAAAEAHDPSRDLASEESARANRVALLSSTFVAFATGSAWGAVSALRVGAVSLLPVVALLGGGAIFTLLRGSRRR